MPKISPHLLRVPLRAFAPSRLFDFAISRKYRRTEYRSGRRAFTLIELMISIAIALVMIIGVNLVFNTAAKTVGAGEALSAISRDNRTAQASITYDIHNASTTSQPSLFILSQFVNAFRTQQEAAAEPSGSAATLTVNHNPISVSTTYPLLGSRTYRTDTLGFFASGDQYQRQTASKDYFVSPTTSSDAYIWYGHLTLPNNKQAAATPWYTQNGGDFFEPGSTTGIYGGANNDNNLYAAQWILGRMAMLLSPNIANSSTASANQPDANYFFQPTSPTVANNPLGTGSFAYGDNTPLYTSRYDIAAVSPTWFGTNYNTPSSRGTMMFRNYTSPANGQPYAPSFFAPFRYMGNPFPTKPLDPVNGNGSIAMAGVAPLFLNHCCHFIVEYAGDYLTQDSNPQSPTYGQVLGNASNNNGAQGDGTVDFVVDPVTHLQRIRWYGFPRDVNGDGAIDMLHDVVPLRDVLQGPIASGGANIPALVAPWEGGSLLSTVATPPANYVTNTNTPIVTPNSQYVCSWGTESSWPSSTGVSNGLPRMLRITVALDDPNGRLAGPQFYEYVIDLGSQH